MVFDRELLARYPNQPGVYLMKDEEGTVIYVGKAKDLQSRIRQYFGQDDRIQIPQLIAHLDNIETIITLSEKEALLLESRLIKRFLPKYNILLKDDKSLLLIRIGMDHEWPRIELIREKENMTPRLFGPYHSSRDAKQLFDLVVRLFQLRQCNNEVFRHRTCPCLLYQLRRCTAPCVGKVHADDYRVQVQEATEFLEGKVSDVRQKLFSDMHQASDLLEFERAGEYLRRIRLLDVVKESFLKKHAKTSKKTDVFGVWVEGNYFAVSIMHYRGESLEYGESFIYEKEFIPKQPEESVFPSTESNLSTSASENSRLFKLFGYSLVFESLEQLCIQYYTQSSEEKPSTILFPQGEWSFLPLEEVLQEHFGKAVHIHQPSIGAKKAFVDLSCENARACIAQNIAGKERRVSVLESLEEKLFLKRFPHTIDCFDASHLSGKDLVAACVRYIQGEPSKSDYRTFIIKKSDTGDDIRMLHEAVKRRYEHAEERGESFPDLILVDGGRHQVNAVVAALRELSLWDTVDVVGIVKELSRHDKGLSAEMFISPEREERIGFSITSQELHFLQTVRDEAHRYVLAFHKKRRKKSLFTSELDSIKGIGEKKKKKLLKAFLNTDAIRKATPQEIAQGAGISLRDATHVLESL